MGGGSKHGGAWGRTTSAVIALVMVAATLAFAPAASSQAADDGDGAGVMPSLLELRDQVDDFEPQAMPDGQLLRGLQQTSQARTSGDGIVPTAITDCTNSIRFETTGEVATYDINSPGIFSDCRFTQFDAVTVLPLDVADFGAYGAFFDADEDAATGCGGFEFVVATLDPLGDTAFVQQRPTCDSSTWFTRPEISVSVLVVPEDGYVAIRFKSNFLLGRSGTFRWFQQLESLSGSIDRAPDAGTYQDEMIPITPAAPANVVAAPASSGGGVILEWDHPGGDTFAFEVQSRSAPLVNTAAGDVAPPPVVGGESISINEAPWSVALYSAGSTPSASQFCGGVLVAPQKVLTAAHCVSTELPEDLMVLVGQTNLAAFQSSQTSEVLSIDIHPSFNEIRQEADVAILSLASSFNVSPLPTINANPNVPVAGTPAFVSGWGAVDDPGGGLTFTNFLQGGDVVVQASPGQACANWSVAAFNPTHHLCAGLASGATDLCFGDSGGGLVTTNGGVSFQLVGIVSFTSASGCGTPGLPGGYARVSTYADWLSQAVASPAFSGDRVTCNASRCAYRVERLVPGDRYEFRVAGVNEAGIGVWSSPVFAVGGTLVCLGRTVTIVAQPGTVTVGTSRGDVIWGTNGDDDIRSGGGNDRVCANAGNDRVTSGPGRDTVSGGAGDDFISAGGGADTVFGGAGIDLIRGQGGRDRLNGGGGADEIDGGGGNDNIKGNGGGDRLVGGNGRDTIAGGGGNDTLEGRGGDDTLNGNNGRDRFNGGAGADTCNGGRGNDRYDGCERIS